MLFRIQILKREMRLKGAEKNSNLESNFNTDFDKSNLLMRYILDCIA